MVCGCVVGYNLLKTPVRMKSVCALAPLPISTQLPNRPLVFHSPARLPARFGRLQSQQATKPPRKPGVTDLGRNKGPQGAKGAHGACAQRGARTCAVAGAGPRSGLRGGWAAARAVDVFGGCGGRRGAGRRPRGGRGAEPGSESALERARPEWSSGREPAGEPCVPGNGSVGRLSRGRWGGKGSGLAAGERRLRLGWACGGACACFGVPRVDPTPPALRPCRRRLPPGGVGRRTLPVPKEVCPARPGKHVLGETWISRPPRPYCHRRASLTRGGRPPPPVPSVPREAALPLLRSVSEPCSCVGPARCALAFFRTVLLLVVLSSPALLVLRPKTSATNAWKL